MIAEEYLAHFQRRVIQDALNEATRSYWLRRAESFEWAKPRLDDFHGTADNPNLSAQWRRADETATACRNRGEMALVQDEYPELVRDVLREEEPCQDAPTRRAS